MMSRLRSLALLMARWKADLVMPARVQWLSSSILGMGLPSSRFSTCWATQVLGDGEDSGGWIGRVPVHGEAEADGVGADAGEGAIQAVFVQAVLAGDDQGADVGVEELQMGCARGVRFGLIGGGLVFDVSDVIVIGFLIVEEVGDEATLFGGSDDDDEPFVIITTKDSEAAGESGGE